MQRIQIEEHVAAGHTSKYKPKLGEVKHEIEDDETRIRLRHASPSGDASLAVHIVAFDFRAFSSGESCSELLCLRPARLAGIASGQTKVWVDGYLFEALHKSRWRAV